MAAGDREDCIDKIVRLSGGKLSRDEAEAALQEILGRADRNGPSWKAMDEKLAAAAQELQDQIIERSSIAKRNERLSALKAIGRHKFYERAPSPAIGLEAKLGGSNVPFAGARYSVDVQYRALRRTLLGGFWNELEAAKTDRFPDGGLERVFLSRKMEKDWAAELHELNKSKGGKPGRTGNPDALAIADAIHQGQKRSIEAINGEGGWVKSYSGYIARTSHNADRIYRAGRDAWIDFVLPHLDVQKTFNDSDLATARKHLEKLWPEFSHGDHFDYSKPLDDTHSLLDIDFARKASAPRELHWKSAADWLSYNERFGRFTPTYAIIHSLDAAARVTALMKVFGPQPRKALEEDFHYLRGRYHEKPEQIRELDAREDRIRNIFAQFDGTAQRPVNAMMAQIGSDVRAVQRMSKLIFTPVAMLSDLAFKASELRYQGFSPLERYGSGITDYFRGYGFVRGKQEGAFKREVGKHLNHLFDSEIGQIANRFDPGEAPVHDFLARAEQRFFRWSGMNSMTFNQRHGSERTMAVHWGDLRDTKFGDLNAAEQRILGQYEIGQPEWELFHKVAWNEINGQTVLTPDVIGKLSDKDMRAYLIAKGSVHQAAKGGAVDMLVDRERADLGLRLAAYFADRGEFAVPEPGARERGTFNFSANPSFRPGTPAGEAWRLFMQFKQFPITVMMKTWGREIYGGQGKMGALAGLTEFFVYASALGVVSNALNDILKGQDPSARWRNTPGGALLSGMLRGGAGSIYGDFLLGEFSRFGRSAIGTLAGPTFGQVDTVFELWSDLTHMKAPQAAAKLGAKLVHDNAPNIIYTKTALDYLIYYRFLEWLNPGYLERMESTMKQKQGTEFWLKPSRVSR